MNPNDLANRPSFFDDDDLTVRFDFRKPAKSHQKDLNQPALLKSMLVKQIPNTSTEQGGYYALHNQTLALYKSNSFKAVDSVLELAHAKVKILTGEEQNSGFALVKNGSTYEFYSQDTQVVEEWITALKGVCVFTNFHDEYKALKMIGKGSFAKVYLVESKSTGKMYAVKAFTKESVIASNKTNAKPSMLNEIEIMRAFDHENVIKLYEVHESEKSIYLVLELIQGKSMQDVLKKPTFREEHSEVKVINMIRSILDALAYIASKDVMHRDLKPDNILIDKDCKVKIADFGLATFCDVPEYIFKKCGTPGYIAPEVFKYDQKNPSTNYDHQCDVFSAGCILYYMLFGHPFFEASDASQILRMNRKFTSEFDAVSNLKIEMKNPNSKISKDGLNLLSQLLEIDPSKRISAEQALSHPYFIPVPSGMSKLAGTNDIIDSKSNPASPFTPKKGQRHSTFTPDQVNQYIKNSESPKFSKNVIKDRFAEKDSLYLDMGKTELNGKTDTLNTGVSTNNNSLLINKRDSHLSVGSGSNPDSASSFSKKTAEKRSKSFRIHNVMGGGGNQSFLKAALLRNMQKNNSDMPGEEYKDDNLPSPQDRLPGRQGFSSERNSSYSQDNDSEEDSQSPKLKPSLDKAPHSPLKTGSTPKRRFQPFAARADTVDPK